MKIYIGSDHAGFEMKRELEVFLSERGYEVSDCGPKSYDPQDDYPDYVSVVAKNVSQNVSKDLKSFGIVIGKSGQGEAMVANRFPNVRCAIFYGGSKHVLTLSREHNDANMLSLGTQFITTKEAKEAVLLWLNTKFSGEERHVRRIKKIENYD
ncbi:MAG: RpiB/LacA/LacB family sugar-phosphate isomerase [Candidatus Zambryskibacteria bacterium]|nr:RpiB/LacA/LacB family sugar-phosphate isomerase [Candidatus Zambryskibacteria bacterium]